MYLTNVKFHFVNPILAEAYVAALLRFGRHTAVSREICKANTHLMRRSASWAMPYIVDIDEFGAISMHIDDYDQKEVQAQHNKRWNN